MAAIAWLLVGLYDIQFVEQTLHGEVGEEIVLVHFLLDIGQVHQCNELDEQLALEVFLRGGGHAAHIQASLRLPKDFSMVYLNCLDGIFHAVGHEREIAEAFPLGADDILLRRDDDSTFSGVSRIIKTGVNLPISEGNSPVCGKLYLRCAKRPANRRFRGFCRPWHPSAPAEVAVLRRRKEHPRPSFLGIWSIFYKKFRFP